MPSETKPCIVCGKRLTRVSDTGYENQPNDAIIFRADGNYGSTVFDPFDGTVLEVIICDECIVNAGDDGKVVTYKPRRPVVVHIPEPEDFAHIPSFIGWERLDRPAVDWHKDLPDYGEDDQLVVELEEVGEPLGGDNHIIWDQGLVRHIKEHYLKER